MCGVYAIVYLKRLIEELEVISLSYEVLYGY